MRRGDVFVWVVYNTGKRADREEELWSRAEGRYVPAGEVNMVISLRQGVVTWCCPRGTYSTLIDDNVSISASGASHWLVVKQLGEGRS